jgi:AcrR family transcriptional regulator
MQWLLQLGADRSVPSMPRIIDHDARRAALASLAADLIAQGGVEAATVRAIAAAGGFSTKVVSHYFQDKRALLLLTYRFAADDSAVLAEAVADARAHLLSLLPISDRMVRNWKVWLAFWAFAISDPAFAAEQRRQVERARAAVAAALGRDPRFTGLSASAREAAARELVTTVIGVALQAAFDPGDWPPERQALALGDRLEAVCGQTT